MRVYQLFIALLLCSARLMAAEQKVLLEQPPYFCRLTPNNTQLCTVYADEYKVWGENVLRRPNILPAELDSGNYLAANFFVAGDVGGCGRSGTVHV